MKPSFSLLAAAAMAVSSLTALAADTATTNPLRHLDGAAFDQAFLTHMSAHQQQGVRMSQLAAERAERPELKQLAQQIAQQQQRDAQELQALIGPASNAHTGAHFEPGTLPVAVASTDGRTKNLPPAAGGAPTQTAQNTETVESFNKLQAEQGAEFDRLFLQEMTKHHQTGHELAQLAASRATNGDVSAFAKKSAQQQQRELEQLQRLQE